MAESVVDIPIDMLEETIKIGDTDLIVIQQDGEAVKASGATLKAWLYEVSQAHGMIQSIGKVGTSGLVDTYRITLADGTTYDFTVTNGKEIKSVTNYFAVSNSSTTAPTSWSTTAKVPTASSKYLWMYTVITYTNGTSTSTTKHVAGVYGDTGAKGDKGDPPALSSQEVVYQVADSGTTVPNGSWSATIPSVGQGKYLWTRVTLTFETGSPVVSYSVAYMGINGEGAVKSVCGVYPDTSGNVALEKSSIGLGNVDNTSDSNKNVKSAASCTGNSATATRLASARTFRANLSSTGAASFDGTGDVTLGVTGTLPIGNGGTGATTAAAALTNLGAMASNKVIRVFNARLSFDEDATCTYSNANIRHNVSFVAITRIGIASYAAHAFSYKTNSDGGSIIIQAPTTFANANMNVSMIIVN